ncbi:hypothetical protein AZE42_07900 [Rhizopogon vesiculosus]|uniref:Uncharacterized protein n=1 Tax=Rhizopogon vesiculosus TaxID=180088 RepID=A0A1J8QP39_9AGAM|nr:hypothetical protein AZE42_07900 [Rhizopogon vesiculosus]
MTNIANTSPASDEDVVANNAAHDHPGAYIVPFSTHAGKRLADVPTKLRWWAMQTRLQANSWYTAFVEANKRYEELLLETPEAYPFPIGEHAGKRLDSNEISEDLIWWAIHPSRSDNAWYQNLVKASRGYLDKVYQMKSPGSVLIWFGKDNLGYRLDDAYKRPGFIRFCLHPAHQGCRWVSRGFPSKTPGILSGHSYSQYYRFQDLVQRYEVHRQTHRRPYHERRAPNVQNPTGQLLGRWDDGRGSVEPDDDYERDGFIVDDDEEETYNEEGSDFESGDSTDDPTVGDDEQDKEERGHSESSPSLRSDLSEAGGDTDELAPQGKRPSPSRASASASQSSEPGSNSDDDDDNMPLDKLQEKTAAKRLSKQSKAEVMSSNNRRRSHQSLSDDSDTTAQPTLKRLKRRSETPKGRRLSAKTDSHSDAESHDAPSYPDEPEPPLHDQLSQSVRCLSLSQESATSSSDADELSRTPSKSPQRKHTHTHTPARLGSRYRLVIDSDDEL